MGQVRLRETWGWLGEDPRRDRDAPQDQDQNHGAIEMSNTRIKEVKRVNTTEFWVQKSIRFLGIHLFWENTTISYFSTMEGAKRHLEDTAKQITIHIRA